GEMRHRDVERFILVAMAILLGLLALGPATLTGEQWRQAAIEQVPSVAAEPEQVMTYILADGNMIAMPTTEVRCRYLRDGLVKGEHALSTKPPWGGPSIDVVAISCGREAPQRRQQAAKGMGL
ncbi:MAG: hypothetical protein AB7E55_36690, partial [Pigmentiphaga sp.]